MSQEILTPSTPLKVINFISGGGSTNLAILEAERPNGILDGVTETVAIISSDKKASGIQKAIDLGFPAGLIFSVNPEKNLAEQLLEIFDGYKPDFFHQLGWMPHTPEEVLAKYAGLNQHFGPGGKGMFGERGAYAHQLFCEMVGEKRPVPVFCQVVDPKYDAGKAVYFDFTDLLPGESPEKASSRILPMEHTVQIEGRKRFALEKGVLYELPKIALTKQENTLMLIAMKEAVRKYPAH